MLHILLRAGDRAAEGGLRVQTKQADVDTELTNRRRVRQRLVISFIQLTRVEVRSVDLDDLLRDRLKLGFLIALLALVDVTVELAQHVQLTS